VKKFFVSAVAAALTVVVLAGCSSDADTADRNIVTAAEQFEIQRTIIGINGITGDIIFYAEGRCSFENYTGRVDVTCRYGPDEYRKHVFITGDQDSVVITQEEAVDVSVYQTRIILKPENLIPNFDLEVGKQ